MPKISSVAASNTGYVRENNEDNFFLNGKILSTSITGTAIESDNADIGLFAVCDGMGGEESGEIASAIAVDTLHEYYQKVLDNSSFNEAVNSYTNEANARICIEIYKNNGKRMGTTFAMLYIENNTAYVYNIGDSRVYLFRNNQLKQMSRDHTQIRQLLEMGILTAEKAKIHPERHKITQHLGIFPEEMVIEPYAAEPMSILEGDIFLLCSDGLSDMLDDTEIEQIITQHPNPYDTISKLIEAALANGGRDNITVIISKIIESTTLL
ncbi:MAG: protein phosphatase 2C domain-containing protein [Firmicutes bacterium]|nr:protein phosphatase 2C domain-containing protein [Bacillota bacterium]